SAPQPAAPGAWAVKGNRGGGEERTSPSRRATTERSPSAPTTTRALHVTRCPLHERATTPATVPPSHTRFSTVVASLTCAPARAAAATRIASNDVLGTAKL